MVIKSIQKEMQESTTVFLGKLRLDFSAKPIKNINKAVTYILKNSELNEDLDTFKEVLINFLDKEPEAVSTLEKESADLDLSLGGGKGVDYTNYLSYKQIDDKGKEVTHYFDLNGKLTQAKNGTGWIRRSDKTKFYVYNGKRLLAVYELYKRLLAVNPKMEEYRGYIVRNVFYKGHGFYNLASMEQEILDALVIAFEHDSNIQLMKDYEKSQDSDYAKAFMTKKNIAEKVADKMKVSKFLNHGFSFLELDNDTDLEKLESIESEWTVTYSKLPKFTKKPELRFRKLGQHKASGLYYPTENCVCVDIRNIQSLVHELGHLYDYTLSDRPLSLTEDFRPIIHAYRENVDKLDEESYVQKKKSYYLTPTEVFARAYELYQFEQLTTSFLKSEEDYTNLDEYTCFTEDMKTKVNTFFNKYMPNK